MKVSPGQARKPVTNTMHQCCAVVRIDQRPGQARRIQPGQARTRGSCWVAFPLGGLVHAGRSQSRRPDAACRGERIGRLI
eukprot:10924258-Lingulodinium_polyedra.AAC.1